MNSIFLEYCELKTSDSAYFLVPGYSTGNTTGNTTGNSTSNTTDNTPDNSSDPGFFFLHYDVTFIETKNKFLNYIDLFNPFVNKTKMSATIEYSG